jgi:methoxymalonate biosynthesis acyl carrier protein
VTSARRGWPLNDRVVQTWDAEGMGLNKESLLRFMEDTLGIDTANLDEHTEIFSSGVIDSAAMVELIEFVESEGNVTFGPDDLTLDHLDSIDRILGFVAGRRDQ